MTFPKLTSNWLPTRDTLQSYSQVLGAVCRALTPPHPRWWNTSLRPASDGWHARPIVVDGGTLELGLDLERHELRASLDTRELLTLKLGEGATSATVATRLREELGRAGVPLPADFHPKRTSAPRFYDPAQAADYLAALLASHSVLADLRQSFAGEVSPLQLWPHHFDLSFEWFGSRLVTHLEDGEDRQDPAQIGFGFSTGDGSYPAAYYYATPWPFDPELQKTELPAGASWYTDRWQGVRLPYSEVEAAGGSLLREAFERAFRSAERTLRD